jgi:hypothetical protein
VTQRVPLDHLTSDQYDQLCDELDRARAELQWHAEHESADAAAGSYAGRAEAAEAAVDRLRADIAACRDQQWPQRLGRAEKKLARIAAIADQYPAGIDTALIHEALDEPTPVTSATSLCWTVTTQVDTHTCTEDQTATTTWLAGHPHHWADGQLVIDTVDGPVPAPHGYLLVRWPDDDVIVMSPRSAAKRLHPAGPTVTDQPKEN